jgi:hypothetical protein
MQRGIRPRDFIHHGRASPSILGVGILGYEDANNTKGAGGFHASASEFMTRFGTPLPALLRHSSTA